VSKRQGDHNPISTILQDFIETNRLQQGLDKVSIKEAWATVMGAAIVKYTAQIKLDRDTLYVQLSSSVLREELSYGKQKIIDLLNEEMKKPLISKLVLR
jgi:hypothetical protein